MHGVHGTIAHHAARAYFRGSLSRFCTYENPNRPFTHSCPLVTVDSMGDVTFTIWSSCTWSVSVQPTPQYGQTVSVLVCASSFHSPSARRSCSLLNMRAPVGQTPMQLPQYTQAESGKGTSSSVEMRASKPRPATAMAKVFCASDPQASTHL